MSDTTISSPATSPEMGTFDDEGNYTPRQVAVDDLGSGIASLAHMSRLGPDFFKVDRSLVTGVHRRPYQAALLNALAVFAERMRVGYIVEGIETSEELQAVIDADVPWGQGFIFGEPAPLVL